MGALSFNEMEIDALGEMMNISLGASATAMSTLLGSTVHITTPKVKILTRDQFEFKKLEPAVGVEIAYVEGLEGSNIMMFRNLQLIYPHRFLLRSQTQKALKTSISRKQLLW